MFVEGKNNNSLSKIEKTGILATVASNNVYIQDVYKETFEEEKANNSKFLSQKINEKDYILQRSGIRKKASIN